MKLKMDQEFTDILTMGKERFKLCQDWEDKARTYWRDDFKFANGDDYNLGQWGGPDAGSLAAGRNSDSKPTLTTNKVKTFINHTKNKMFRNKLATKFRAVSDTTAEAAIIYEGIYRHIEYESNAREAQAWAVDHMLTSGIGWWRIKTDYVDNQSMNQKIIIKRVPDQLSIYIDPTCKEFDKSDAKFGFVFEEILKHEFEERYPQYKDMSSSISVIGNERDYDEWYPDKGKFIRVAEYYCKSSKRQKLHHLKDGSTITDDEIAAKDNWKSIKSKVVGSRWIIDDKIDWYLIAGSEIIDHRPYLGKYIPLVCCIGEEIIMDGTMDRKGMTRYLISPQKMYDTWISENTEYMLLQTKVPFIAPNEAIEEYQGTWKNMNNENPTVLAYKHKDDQGNPIPPPTRIEPPSASQGYESGIQIADKDMQIASGIFDAQLGAPSNERTGAAINARTSDGENATDHYNQNFVTALIFTGKIIMDLIPKIMDTEQIVKILCLDNSTVKSVQIDPNGPVSHMKINPTPGEQITPDTIVAVLNPNIGEYAVIADVSPDYQTKKLQDLNDLGELMKEVPSLVPILGDLYVQQMDIDLGPEISARLKRMVPPQALGQGPTPMEQQLHQALLSAQGMVQKLMQDNMKLTAKTLEQQVQKEIDFGVLQNDQYKAETERLKVMDGIVPGLIEPIAHKMALDAVSHPIDPMISQTLLHNQILINALNGTGQQQQLMGQQGPGPQGSSPPTPQQNPGGQTPPPEQGT